MQYNFLQISCDEFATKQTQPALWFPLSDYNTQTKFIMRTQYKNQFQIKILDRKSIPIPFGTNLALISYLTKGHSLSLYLSIYLTESNLHLTKPHKHFSNLFEIRFTVHWSRANNTTNNRRTMFVGQGRSVDKNPTTETHIIWQQTSFTYSVEMLTQKF